MIKLFGCDVIKSVDKSIFEYILNLTKNTSALGSYDACLCWFEVFSYFKDEFWNSSDLRDECWLAQYNHFRIITLDFLSNDSSKRNYLFLVSRLTDKDIVIGNKESYKQAVREFIANEYILPETRFMVMYCCSELYGTDTKFLKEISADNFSSIDNFFSDCEKVHHKEYLEDCLSVYSTDEIAGFIKKYLDINENNRWKFLAIWKSVVKRCKDKASPVKITDFFPTPKDLFDFYEKTHPQFLKTDISKLKRSCISDGNYKDLYDCLKKYKGEEIASFMKNNNKPIESIFIWASLIEYDNRDWCKSLFKKPKDIIDFYINKVPDEFKNLKDFYVFLNVGYICEDTKLWQDYFKSILAEKNQTHIKLFLDLFDGKINLETSNHSVEYGIGTIMENIFNGFDDLKSFLDFYIEIYSNSKKNFLETQNAERDRILQLMINKCERHCNWDLIESLLNICDKKYDFFVPLLINRIISKDNLNLCGLSCIVQFLSKKNDLNQDLKSQLLNKIDALVKSDIESFLHVEYEDESHNEYNSDAFIYPYDFETKLKYVIEIMNSNEVLPETKKKVYDWSQKAIEEDKNKWQCVLEMHVYNIEQDKKPKKNIDLSVPSLVPISLFVPFLNSIQQNSNNGNKNDENNKYKYLQYRSIYHHKSLKTLKSHQGNWHLADLENSHQLRELNIRIDDLNNQINTLQNRLNKTEFKLGWILIAWFSGIGTIILLGLRYYWNSSKNNLGTTKNTLLTEKQNPENKIKADCEKKKTDYEASLKKAKEAMKKWGKSKNNKDYPYDNHKKYCQLLKQIIDIYEGKNHILSASTNGILSTTNKTEYKHDTEPYK